MPNFDLRIASAPGLAVVPWTDPVIAAAPTRLNPLASHGHNYLSVTPPGTVEFRATVDGVDAPMDAALGGDLFQSWWVEWSGPFPPVLVPAAAQSSKVTCYLTVLHLGLFRIGFRRSSGGAILLPFCSDLIEEEI